MYGRRGENCPFYGKHHTAEMKAKIRQVHLGLHHTEEARRKIAEAGRGRPNAKAGLRLFNDGTKYVWAKECPAGFVPGRMTSA